MSQKYVEMVIIAARGIGEGFVRGWLRARGDSSEVLNLEREEIERESFRELLQEIAHPGEEVAHLLVPEPARAAVLEALSALEKEGFPAAEKTSRTYGQASAQFSLEVFNAEAGGKAKLLLEKPEEGVRVELRKKITEALREGAKGVELYAPDHSYELRAGGSMEGAIRPVLSMIASLRSLGAEITKITLS